MLKPSVRQMLEIGKGCGLDILGEAYSQYMNHYDCFFSVSEYAEQNRVFKQEIADLGWIDEEGFLFEDLTIEECLEELDK